MGSGAYSGRTRAPPAIRRSTRFMPATSATWRWPWRWSAREQGAPPPSGRTQISPIVVNGVLYTTIGNQRSVIALDAATGEPLWNWHPGDNERRWGDIIEPVARSAGRGVSYWTDGAGDERIFVVTPSFQLVALDARTGNLVTDFGSAGVVDMMDDLRWSERPAAERAGRVANTSPPAILGNALVASISLHTGSIPTRASPNEVWPMNMPGDIVAYDTRTGRRLWRFNTVPREGEFGVDTWLQGGRHPLGRAHRHPRLGAGAPGAPRRLVEVHGERRALGARDGRPRDRPVLRGHRDAHERLLRRLPGRGTTSSATPCWRSTRRPASGHGTFSSPITSSGTTTSPPPPSSWTSRSTAFPSRRWCSSRSRGSPTC